MSKGVKITIISLVAAALLLVVLFFIFGKTKEYTITFDTDGGSEIANQIVKEGELVTKPNDPTKDGYEFTRWEYNNILYDFSKTVTSDMTLKAIWHEVEEIKKYDIVFKVDGQEKTLSVSELTEESLKDLGFEEKAGYIIKWYVNDKEYDFTTPLTENMTLVGKYEKVTSYTVKFNANGGTSVSNQTVNSGDLVKEPTNVTKYGYILDGWYVGNDKYDFSTKVTKNMTLTAKWSEDSSVKRYTITFDSNGGSKVTSQTVMENKTASQPKTPTRSGYGFDGWYLDNAFKTKYNFSSKVTGDITLIAKWHELAKYTVTFTTNGGTSVSSQTITEGGKVKEPTKPTKSNYVFKEWQLDGKKYDFNSKVTKSITLVAIWENQKPKYTVKFNSNGGTSYASQVVTEGEKAINPGTPTRSGYTFKGWYVGNSQYDFNSKVMENITIEAKWEEVVKYEIVIGKVDKFSPARTIKVLKNGTQISVKAIKAGSDGVELCKGSNLTVDAGDIENEKTLIVVLTDGKEVRVNVK